MNVCDKKIIKVSGGPQMFMQQGSIPMNAVRPSMGGGSGGGGAGSGMPMGNFVGQGPNVLPGPLAFLEKTTSNIGKNKGNKVPNMRLGIRNLKLLKLSSNLKENRSTKHVLLILKSHFPWKLICINYL